MNQTATITDLAPMHQVIAAGDALCGIDTSQLNTNRVPGTLLELLIRALREGNAVGIHFCLDALGFSLTEANLDPKPLHAFAMALAEGTPGPRMAAFAALPEAADFGNYVLTVVRRASLSSAELH